MGCGSIPWLGYLRSSVCGLYKNWVSHQWETYVTKCFDSSLTPSPCQYLLLGSQGRNWLLWCSVVVGKIQLFPKLFSRYHTIQLGRWCMPLIPTLGRQVQMDEFCKVSSRIARAVAQRNSPDKTQEKGRKKGREGGGGACDSNSDISIHFSKFKLVIYCWPSCDLLEPYREPFARCNRDSKGSCCPEDLTWLFYQLHIQPLGFLWENKIFKARA